jgi:hypothetical protein
MHVVHIKDEMPPLADPPEREAAVGVPPVGEAAKEDDGDDAQSDTSMTTRTDKTASTRASRRRPLKHRERKALRTMEKVRQKKAELGLPFTPWTSRRALSNAPTRIAMRPDHSRSALSIRCDPERDATRPFDADRTHCA